LRDQPRGDEIDTVVLACTHFPLLEEELQAALGPDVALVHGAAGIARRIVFRTQGQDFSRIQPDRFVHTGDIGKVAKLRPALASYGLETIERL
jgi:glutamate racemase